MWLRKSPDSQEVSSIVICYTLQTDEKHDLTRAYM